MDAARKAQHFVAMEKLEMEIQDTRKSAGVHQAQHLEASEKLEKGHKGAHNCNEALRAVPTKKLPKLTKELKAVRFSKKALLAQQTEDGKRDRRGTYFGVWPRGPSMARSKNND